MTFIKSFGLLSIILLSSNSYAVRLPMQTHLKDWYTKATDGFFDIEADKLAKQMKKEEQENLELTRVMYFDIDGLDPETQLEFAKRFAKEQENNELAAIMQVLDIESFIKEFGTNAEDLIKFISINHHISEYLGKEVTGTSANIATYLYKHYNLYEAKNIIRVAKHLSYERKLFEGLSDDFEKMKVAEKFYKEMDDIVYGDDIEASDAFTMKWVDLLNEMGY